MRPLRELWYLTEYAATQSLVVVLSVLPVRLVLWLGDAVALALYYLLPARRRVAVTNILEARVCAGERAARKLARASFRTLAATVVETIVARRRIRPEDWPRHVRMDVPEATARLLQEPGQGLLVATAHLGNWEVVARAASTIKPLSAIYKPFTNPYLTRWMEKRRSGENLRLFSKYDDDPMRFLRSLQSGEALAIMIDQHARGDSGVPVEFFGRKAKTTTSVAMLHLVTRTPLIVACGIRTAPLQYEVLATEPIEYERTGDRRRDVLEITQRISTEVEKMVRAHPGQYLWGHRRWKYAEKAAAAAAAAAAELRLSRT